MDISGFVTRLVAEIKAFVAATDQRAYLLDRAALYFDSVAPTIDFPGPDKLVAPMVRMSLLWVIGSIYDAVDALDSGGKTYITDGLPEPPAEEESADVPQS